MGLSIRAYARHRGVSHVAVKKAIDTGRISQLPDGTIDPVVADAQWAANTTPTRRSVADLPSDKPAPQVSAPAREIPQTSAATPTRLQREAPEVPTPALSSGGTSLLQARTVNEVVKAQTNKVRLARLKGELVDRSQAVAHVFKLAISQQKLSHARQTRKSDALLSYLMHARNVDEHTVRQVVAKRPGSLKITGGPGGGTIHRGVFSGDGQVGNLVYEGALDIDFVPERMEIIGVTDRGVLHDIPAHHLSVPLKSLIPHDLAQLALDYYKSLLNGN